jgi:hypothetical protein
MRFFVFKLALTNIWAHVADPYTDLTLTMIVKPGYVTDYPAGWTWPDREPVFDAIQRAAAKQFGGALPWSATAPSQTTIYTAVIIMLRAESHYGLYNFIPNRKPVFLVDTGL